jgi:hypothetical protein
MPGRERAVMTNDLDEFGADMWPEKFGSNWSVTGVTEDLSDVVAERSEDISSFRRFCLHDPCDPR